MLQTLKSNFNYNTENYDGERQHIVELTEANTNMSFALKHLEQRFEQAE